MSPKLGGALYPQRWGAHRIPKPGGPTVSPFGIQFPPSWGEGGLFVIDLGRENSMFWNYVGVVSFYFRFWRRWSLGFEIRCLCLSGEEGGGVSVFLI